MKQIYSEGTEQLSVNSLLRNFVREIPCIPILNHTITHLSSRPLLTLSFQLRFNLPYGLYSSSFLIKLSQPNIFEMLTKNQNSPLIMAVISSGAQNNTRKSLSPYALLASKITD
jgi:hypothetical protein